MHPCDLRASPACTHMSHEEQLVVPCGCFVFRFFMRLVRFFAFVLCPFAARSFCLPARLFACLSVCGVSVCLSFCCLVCLPVCPPASNACNAYAAVCVHVCIDVHVSIAAHTHVCMRVSVCAHTHVVHSKAHAHMCAHTCVHTHMCTHAASHGLQWIGWSYTAHMHC